MIFRTNLLAQVPAPTFPDLHDIALPNGENATTLIPAPLIPWWIWGMVGILLLIIGILLWRLFSKNKAIAEPSAREEAVTKLHTLRTEMAQMQPYAFSIAVCDILKNYCERRFQLPVTRQTSPEFLAQIQNHNEFLSEERDRLAKFLGRCDAIKFARAEAGESDKQFLLETATEFIEKGEG